MSGPSQLMGLRPIIFLEILKHADMGDQPSPLTTYASHRAALIAQEPVPGRQWCAHV